MGEQVATAAAWLGGAVAAVAVLLCAAVAARRYVLARGGGMVWCFLRAQPGPGGGGRAVWRAGCGRYGTRELDWYPVFSLRPLPAVRLPRRGLVILGRHTPESPRLRRSADDVIVLEIAGLTADGAVPESPTHQLAMSERALTGFLSWLEAAPPGARYLS